VTREFLAVYLDLLAGRVVNRRGKHISIEDGRLLFPPLQQPHLPLYFSGSSEVAATVAAETIDKYLTWGEPPAQVEEKIGRVAALTIYRPRP
jgi:alkanesulfonate monooxygenase